MQNETRVFKELRESLTEFIQEFKDYQSQFRINRMPYYKNDPTYAAQVEKVLFDSIITNLERQMLTQSDTNKMKSLILIVKRVDTVLHEHLGYPKGDVINELWNSIYKK